jgi:hypothetical protein
MHRGTTELRVSWPLTHPHLLATYDSAPERLGEHVRLDKWPHRLKISVTEGDPVDQKSRLPIRTRRAP